VTLDAIVSLLTSALDSARAGAAARADAIDTGEWRRLREGRWQRATAAELDQVARHEAAHCACAARLSVGIRYVLLRHDGSGETCLDPPHVADPYARASICLAGPCADLQGGVERTRQELAGCHDVLRAALALDECSTGVREVLVTSTAATVVARWHQITRVARLLRERRELDGLTVVRTMYT
jgi:hypothetical protein